MIPNESDCEPNAFSESTPQRVLQQIYPQSMYLPIEEVSDNGSDCSVLYEIDTAPSGVYSIGLWRTALAPAATVASDLRIIVLTDILVDLQSRERSTCGDLYIIYPCPYGSGTGASARSNSLFSMFLAKTPIAYT